VIYGLDFRIDEVRNGGSTDKKTARGPEDTRNDLTLGQRK
jgi:hypothetical protein